jgi:hypothetical protein
MLPSDGPKHYATSTLISNGNADRRCEMMLTIRGVYNGKTFSPLHNESANAKRPDECAPRAMP